MKKIGVLNIVLVLSIICSAFTVPVSADTETEETVFQYMLDNSNYGFLQAENVTVVSEIAEIIEDDNAFSGKSVLVKQAGSPAVKLELIPRKNGNSIIWLRYSAESKSSNGVYITVGDKKNVFYELPVTGKNKYQWVRIGLYQSFNASPLAIEISGLESGFCIDSFVHTEDTLWEPSSKEEDFALKMDLTLQPMHGQPMPQVFPKPEHPRVLISKEMIPEIKANMTHPENEKAYTRYKSMLEYEGDGLLPAVTSGTNRDDTLMMTIEAFAFSYVVEGNLEHGKRAVQMCKNMLSSFYMDESLIYHNGTNNIWIAAIVYDWCYDLLTKEDMLFMRYYVEQICRMMSSTHPYPYDVMAKGGVGPSAWTVTHPFRDDLAFAIASYDEYPDWYNYIASLLINEYAPFQDYYIPGETMPSGSSYGYVRWYAFGWSKRLMEVATGYNPYKTDYTRIMLQWIYEQTPEGQYFRSGDDTIAALSATDSPVVKGSYTTAFFLAARDQEDPYLKSAFKYYAQLTNPNYATYTAYFNSHTPVMGMILNDPTIEAKSFDNLPLTKYFGEPFGKMVARTGWDTGVDTDDVIAYMYVGEERVTNHGHADSGTYQLYYKGLLLPDLGHYARTDQPQYYYHSPRTVSHNALLIRDPNEDQGAKNLSKHNVGNQRYINDQQWSLSEYLKDYDIYKKATVTGQEFGPDKFKPEYTYISGDITDSYTDKVDDVRRYMMFMPTDNEEVPAVMIVFDKVDSANASFKKKMLLQAYEEPTIKGNVVTMARSTEGFTGAATNQILYPQNAVIEPVGGIGKQWYIEGVNYNPYNVAADSLEYGWGRVEITPDKDNELDYFLNAIYVHDTMNNTELQQAELIETDDLIGAKLLNKVVMFPKASERTMKDLNFNVSGNEKIDVAVTGIQSGTWKVTVDGKDTGDYYATEEGGMIYFKTTSGDISLKYVSPEVKDTFSNDENAFNDATSKYPDIEFRVNASKRYSENPLMIKNGTCYIPFETLFENLNAEISYSEDGKTASAIRSGTVISFTVGETKINCSTSGLDMSWENDVPIWENNGSIMVPVRSSAKVFGGTTSWYNYPQIVNVAINTEGQKSNISGLVPIIGSFCSESATASAYLTFDNDPKTIWTASGDESWIVWELPYAADINAFVYDSNRTISDERQYIFDLYYSLDGVEYTPLYSGMSNVGGSPLVVNLPKGIKAQYFKFVGHTNTKPTVWNNIAEMQFYEKKVNPDDVK